MVFLGKMINITTGSFYMVLLLRLVIKEGLYLGKTTPTPPPPISCNAHILKSHLVNILMHLKGQVVEKVANVDPLGTQFRERALK